MHTECFNVLFFLFFLSTINFLTWLTVVLFCFCGVYFGAWLPCIFGNIFPTCCCVVYFHFTQRNVLHPQSFLSSSRSEHILSVLISMHSRLCPKISTEHVAVLRENSTWKHNFVIQNPNTRKICLCWFFNQRSHQTEESVALYIR